MKIQTKLATQSSTKPGASQAAKAATRPTRAQGGESPAQVGARLIGNKPDPGKSAGRQQSLPKPKPAPESKPGPKPTPKPDPKPPLPDISGRLPFLHLFRDETRGRQLDGGFPGLGNPSWSKGEEHSAADPKGYWRP